MPAMLNLAHALLTCYRVVAVTREGVTQKCRILWLFEIDCSGIQFPGGGGHAVQVAVVSSPASPRG